MLDKLGSQEPEVRKPQATVSQNPAPALPVEFCPVCAARLEPRRCKAVCPRCGYFMSCSEFE